MGMLGTVLLGMGLGMPIVTASAAIPGVCQVLLTFGHSISVPTDTSQHRCVSGLHLLPFSSLVGAVQSQRLKSCLKFLFLAHAEAHSTSPLQVSAGPIELHLSESQHLSFR